MAMTSMPLPPGFRFHPTDVELVKYYLKRKVLGKKFRFDAIADVDIYKHAPWDLPDKSALRSKDLKWYFFCARGKKYATGGRMNRATDFGYWKATGKDRPVDYKNEVVGKIRTLVFHQGKPPKGDRTDWVMHEYRLEDKDLADKGVVQDAYVLCVVFQKDGPGPRNGAQYGAPFSEEDWSDDDEEVDCGGAASSDGLSGPGFVLPNNQISSVATSEGMCIGTTSESCPSNTLPSSAGLSGPGFVLPNNQISYVATTSHLPEGMCIGTSESCLSNTLPSSANLSGPGFGLPNNEISSVVTTTHLPEGMCIGTISESYLSNTLPSCNVLPTVSGVPVEAPQVQNDEVLDLDLMLDCFGEDVTLVSNENNSNEELDNLSRDGNVEDPSFGLDGNGNDFFKGLEDLDNMGGLSEGGYDFSSGYRPAYTPQMLYLELQDLDDSQHVFGLNQSPPMLPGEPHGFEDHVDVFHEGNGASGSVNQGYGSCEAALDNWDDAPF